MYTIIIPIEDGIYGGWWFSQNSVQASCSRKDPISNTRIPSFLATNPWGSSSEVVGYNIFSAKLKKSRHDPEQVGLIPITWVFGRYIDN
jgi:hypothetical protein